MKSCEMWNKSEITLGCAEKKLSIYHWKSVESVPGEEGLKMGWVVRNRVSPFLIKIQDSRFIW